MQIKTTMRIAKIQNTDNAKVNGQSIYIQTLEYYSELKRNELLSHEKMQRKQMRITK
jgi:hypothetical protein